MKKHTNAELIALLEKARDKHLWKGNGCYSTSRKTRYVCYAINLANGGSGDDDSLVPAKLEKLVRAHIGHYGTMSSFLYTKLTRWPLKEKDVQTYRLMMINNMIKMLSKGTKK